MTETLRARPGVNIKTCPFCKGAAFVSVTMRAMAVMRGRNTSMQLDVKCPDCEKTFGLVLTVSQARLI